MFPEPGSIPLLTTIADLIANLLRGPQQMMRGWILGIDVFSAKCIFIAYFILLICWVMTLKRDEVYVTNEQSGKTINLRPYAIAALVSQVLIYAWF